MKLFPLIVLLATPALVAPPAEAQTAHYLSLDGDQDYVFAQGLQGLSGVTAYTVEAWVRSSGGNWANKLLIFGSEPATKWAMQASCGAGAVVSFAEEMPQPVGGAQLDWPTSSFCDGAWHHVAYTADGTFVSAYLDGVLVGTVPSLGQTWNMDGRDMYAGARLLGDDDYWDGDLDELRVWRRALTPQEIATSATWQLPADTTDLVSAWDFENGAADALGLNNANLAGDATIVATPGFVDCNGNGLMDSLDITSGTSADCNQDGVPDECQLTLWNSADFAAGVPADMSLANNATWQNGAIRLNGSSEYHSSDDFGAVEFNDSLAIDPQAKLSAEWSFRFKITGNYDIMMTRVKSSDFYTPGADRFMFQVEFDHYYNTDQPPTLEPNGNHISVRIQSWVGGVFTEYWPGVPYIPSFTLASGGWHTARVRVHNGGLSVWVTPDGGVEEQAFDTVPLPGTWADDSKLSFVAWNGSGPGGNEHWIDDITVTTTPCAPFSVSSVLPRASWEATDIAVLGIGFDGTETAMVDGSPSPISSWSPTQLNVALAPTAPGFAEVSVAQGALVDSSTLELWPTLSATSTGLGGIASVNLGFTGIGLHVLAFSDATTAPAPVGGSWHGLELALSPSFAILAAGVSAANGQAAWAFTIPNDPTLAGMTIQLQAWSQEGFFVPTVSSFSNTSALTF